MPKVVEEEMAEGREGEERVFQGASLESTAQGYDPWEQGRESHIPDMLPSHTHTPLHMFEQNYKSSVTQNSFQFILFIIDIFSHS